MHDFYHFLISSLLSVAKTKTPCFPNAAFHFVWMTFPSQCNKQKLLILILHLLFAKTQALHSYYNAQNDIKQSFLSPGITPCTSKSQCVVIGINFFTQAIISCLGQFFSLLMQLGTCSSLLYQLHYSRLLFVICWPFSFVIILSLCDTPSCNFLYQPHFFWAANICCAIVGV